MPFRKKLNSRVMQSLKSKGSVSEGSPAGQESCLKEASLEGGCPEAKVLTHLMGLGSSFHTFSVWKNEWKQENWREEKKRKKETGPSVFILKGKVNKQEEWGGETWYPIYSISVKTMIKKWDGPIPKWCNYDGASFERKFYLVWSV